MSLQVTIDLLDFQTNPISLFLRLVTTVGQDLDIETQGRLAKGPQTGINDLSVYFKEMSKLVEQKKISSRVRFLMQVSART